MDQVKEFLVQNKIIVIGVMVLLLLYVMYKCRKSGRQEQPVEQSKSVQPVEQSKPVGKRLVFFYADWCGHCKSMKPVWAELEQKHAGGDVKIMKFEADAHPEIMKENQIDGFPTIKFFGENDNTGIEYSGDRSLEDIEEFLSKNL